MKEVIYRKFCPICKGPLDVPIWKLCNNCSKTKYNRMKRETYKATEKTRLYQIEYRKKNADKLKAYKQKYRSLYK